MDWRCVSSGRVPALSALSPEFKPQSHTKKERREGGREGRRKEGRKAGKCSSNAFWFKLPCTGVYSPSNGL
jgi:hypothetical protein